jgi:uncharacterized protein (DUF1499 family)
MKWLLLIILLLLLLVVGFACASRQPTAPGLEGGRLRSCPNSRNCVCSERSESSAFIASLPLKGSVENSWKRAKAGIKATGGVIQRQEPTYLWATYTTSIFRFVDDVELRLAGEQGVIHLRSASRVGYADLGLNRKRMEALRAYYLGPAGQADEAK